MCFSSSSSSQASKQTTSSTAGANSPSSSGDSSPIAYDSTQILLGQGAHIDSDPAVVASAFQTISQVIGEALSNQGDTTKIVAQGAADSQGALTSLASEVLSADQATAANTASGGQTNENKTVLYIVLAIAAAAAAIFIFKK